MPVQANKWWGTLVALHKLHIWAQVFISWPVNLDEGVHLLREKEVSILGLT